MILDFSKEGLSLIFEVNEYQRVLLKHFSANAPRCEINKVGTSYAIGDVHLNGTNQDSHHGFRHTGHYGTYSLKYVSHKLTEHKDGKTLEFLMTDGKMNVTVHYRMYDGINAIRSYTTVENISDENIGLVYVPSFSYCGIEDNPAAMSDNITVYVPHNSTVREGNWVAHKLHELGYDRSIYHDSTKRISISNTGSWSAKDYLPMGAISIDDDRNTMLWQIENNGSWQWEISNDERALYIKLSGPSEQENHWYHELSPGESFESVKAAIAVGCDFNAALEEMTKYRRTIIHNNKENAAMPVIFNDYMNCLWGQPTEEKELPLIEQAAAIGAEYYCMDAGWYAEGGWWDMVGEWLPSIKRFPSGIRKVFDHVRANGMKPGLWVEIEVMGVNCPLATKLPDECFFMRHGKRVIDHGRYQLDFRHPLVRKHAFEVMERIVNEYGIEYVKIDYNIDAGIGTEVNSDSFGDGLLSHNRAYLDWLREIKQKYPSLIIECCSSGGMRLDYAMLSEGHLQSISDHTNYLKTAYISANAPIASLPEQAAIWSYPMENASDDIVAMNMVNTMLQRIHLSGHLWGQTESGSALIREALECYKSYRDEIPEAIPFYPIGRPTFRDDFAVLAFKYKSAVRLAVWRFESESESIYIPLDADSTNARVIYPKQNACTVKSESGGINVRLKNKNSAVIIEIKA